MTTDHPAKQWVEQTYGEHLTSGELQMLVAVCVATDGKPTSLTRSEWKKRLPFSKPSQDKYLLGLVGYGLINLTVSTSGDWAIAPTFAALNTTDQAVG